MSNGGPSFEVVYSYPSIPDNNQYILTAITLVKTLPVEANKELFEFVSHLGTRTYSKSEFDKLKETFESRLPGEICDLFARFQCVELGESVLARNRMLTPHHNMHKSSSAPQMSESEPFLQKTTVPRKKFTFQGY